MFDAHACAYVVPTAARPCTHDAVPVSLFMTLMFDTYRPYILDGFV